eukprot:331097-Chlamydomonas_euryale.AAC.2
MFGKATPAPGSAALMVVAPVAACAAHMHMSHGAHVRMPHGAHVCAHVAWSARLHATWSARVCACHMERTYALSARGHVA